MRGERSGPAYVRCYMDTCEPPRVGDQERRPEQITAAGRRIREILGPHVGYSAVIQCETGGSQRLRYGIFAVFGLSDEELMRLERRGGLTPDAADELASVVVFYDPAQCTRSEVEAMGDWTRRRFMDRCVLLLTLPDFIREHFYSWAYNEQALVIGHALPWAVSRLATDWWGVKQAPRDIFSNGFVFKLCDCGQRRCYWHPPIQVRHIDPVKAFVGFGVSTLPSKIEGAPRLVHSYNGRFLDVAMLGRGMHGPKGGTTLEELSRRFGLEYLPPQADPRAPIDGAHLSACWEKVLATWRLYQAEREGYRGYNLSTPMWNLYSGASRTKATWKEMGVPRFTEQHGDFPKERKGHAMAGFSGGRSEVMVRLAPTEIIYCDMKANYATCNALMRLQDVCLAERIEVRSGNAYVEDLRAWLASPRLLEQLQRPETWPRLRAFCLIKPHGDLLPLRLPAGTGDTIEPGNLADCYVYRERPMWYPLADVVGSVIRTEKGADVLDAFELVPVGRVKTKPVKLSLAGFGDQVLDTDTDDMCVRLVELGNQVKQKAASVPPSDPERARLTAIADGLKDMAITAAYGCLVELDQDAPTMKGKRVSIYGMEHQERTVHVIEREGGYAALPIGVLVPAAGRLMLAIAERLAADRGLGHAIAATDMMGFVRPEGMDRRSFRRRVRSITRWFQRLSPYRDGQSIFKIEDENYWKGRLCALHCIAVSPNRYVLYNRLRDGSYRVRKFSMHGAGGWLLDDYEPPPDIPEPHTDVAELANGTGKRWMYDMWYRCIQQVETGIARDRDIVLERLPGLDVPARLHVPMSTPRRLADYMKDRDGKPSGIGPLDRITLLPALGTAQLFWRLAAWDRPGPCPYAGLGPDVHFYGPYTETMEEFAGQIRRSDTGELMPPDFEYLTMRELFSGYFRYPNSTMEDPHAVEKCRRIHYHVTGLRYISKESDQLLVDEENETAGILAHPGPEECGTPSRAAELEELVAGMKEFTVSDLAREAEMDSARVRDYRAGKRVPGEANRRRIVEAIERLRLDQQNRRRTR